VKEEDAEALEMGELDLTAPKFDNRPASGEGTESDIIVTSGPFLLRFKFEQGTSPTSLANTSVKRDYKKGAQCLSVSSYFLVKT
jgi:hypothetical protein